MCDVRFFETVEELESLANDDTSLVFIEVPTSSTIRIIDVAAGGSHRAPRRCCPGL